MSYARFGPESDVYVFLSVSGALECCGCLLGDHSYSCQTTDEMVVHLEEHKAAGHDVPGYTIEELREDQASNDAWIAAGAPDEWEDDR